jgi:hypothetical protein
MPLLPWIVELQIEIHERAVFECEEESDALRLVKSHTNHWPTLTQMIALWIIRHSVAVLVPFELTIRLRKCTCYEDEQTDFHGRLHQGLRFAEWLLELPFEVEPSPTFLRFSCTGKDLDPMASHCHQDVMRKAICRRAG